TCFVKRKMWRWSLPLCAALLAVSLLGACGGGNGGGGNAGAGTSAQNEGEDSGASGADMEQTAPANAEEPFKLSFMLPAFGTELPDDSSPVVQKLEEYTNTDVELLFVPNSSYPDKVNITLASGQLPTIMVVDRNSASFINAARSGAFW